MIKPEEKYYGKYRGVVINNVDPIIEGRLMVQVPDVAGLPPPPGPCPVCRLPAYKTAWWRFRSSVRASGWNSNKGIPNIQFGSDASGVRRPRFQRYRD